MVYISIHLSIIHPIKSQLDRKTFLFIFMWRSDVYSLISPICYSILTMINCVCVCCERSGEIWLARKNPNQTTGHNTRRKTLESPACVLCRLAMATQNLKWLTYFPPRLPRKISFPRAILAPGLISIAQYTIERVHQQSETATSKTQTQTHTQYMFSFPFCTIDSNIISVSVGGEQRWMSFSGSPQQ